MTLRILAGEFKGRPLKSPRGMQTRPTTSMVRKAVFDMLQSTILETRFLDIFAGSGAMGLEALSRGAAHSTFIENHKMALQAIHYNIDMLHLKAKTTVYSLDVFESLKRISKKEERFDLIYADPPYNRLELFSQLLSALETSALLNPSGLFFLETPLEFKLPSLHHFTLIDQRRFGSSVLLRLRRLES